MPVRLASPSSPGSDPAPPLGYVAHQLSCPFLDTPSLCKGHSRQQDDPGNEAALRLADAAEASNTSDGWVGGVS